MADTQMDLHELARQCEARAARGEKPVLEWSDTGAFQELHNGLTVHTAAATYSLAGQRIGLCALHQAWFLTTPTVQGYGCHSFTKKEGAQLFAESLLRRATAPLHASPDAARPIAELPEEWKDGREVQFYVRDPEHPEHDTWVIAQYHNGQWMDTKPSSFSFTFYHDRFTHFMAMPAPPEGER